jgi:hypothetical protein
MLKNRIVLLIGVIIGILVLSACAAKPTLDPNMKITEIASTVQAELTKISALTPTVTPTLEPTATPTLEPATATLEVTQQLATPTLQLILPTSSGVDNSKFLGDVNYPDGSVFKKGTTFTKTWKFQNTGKTTWTTGYKLIYLQGLLGTNEATFFSLKKDVKPGEIAEVSANFTAPMVDGRYDSYWKLYSASGYPFGEYCSTVFIVGNATAEPTTAASPTATLTLSPTP